jgi:replicative DNA helicase
MSQQDSFPFDRDFQIGVLGLMAQRYDFLLTATELLKPEYFQDEILVWFFQTMLDHYVKYQEQPFVDPVVENELKKAARLGRIKPAKIGDYAFVCTQLRKPVNAQSYVINEVVRFCRRQEGRRIYMETAPLMDTADDQTWDDIIDRISSAAALGTNFLDIGCNYFNEAAERVRKRMMGDAKRAIPVGISELDALLNGGLKVGQLGIWMGGTGGGKSIALPHCGKRAVVNGYRVAHYTLELDEDDVAERYDASWTRTPLHELAPKSRTVGTQLQRLGMRYADRLMIKHYPTGTASINTIKSHLKQMAGFGWEPDLILVDYGDLLKPLTSYNDEYSDLGSIFKDLRGLAGLQRVPVWTATQTNRGGLNSEIVDLDSISDSLKKAMIADVIIAICATQEDRKANVLRLHLAKNRNGPSKAQVEIRSAYDRMAFWDSTAPSVQQQAGQQGPPPPPPSAPKRRRPKTTKGATT